MKSLDIMSVQERIDEFNKELVALTEKYNLAVSSEPFIHDGKVFAKPVLVDTKPKIAPSGATPILTPPKPTIITDSPKQT